MITDNLTVITTSIRDVLAVYRVCSKKKIKIQFLGKGFSCNPLFKGDGIKLKHQPEIESAWINASQVMVGPDSTWQQVLTFLKKRKKSFPVLTAKHDTSISGTLSVGGYGIRSLQYGCQSSYVAKIQIITPINKVLWCSPTENSELFYSSLSGLGQVGLMHKIILNTIDEQPPTYQYCFVYSSLIDMVQNLKWIEAPGTQLPDTFRSFIGKSDIFYSKSFKAFWGISVNRDKHDEILPLLSIQDSRKTLIDDVDTEISNDVNSWINCFRQHEKFLMDYVFDYQNYLLFVAYIDALLKNPVLKKYLEGIYLLVHQNQNKDCSPLFACHNSPHKYLFGIGLYFMVPDTDNAGYKSVIVIMKSILDMCLKFKGRPYRYGWYDLSEQQYLSLYEKEHRDLIKLKSTYDPFDILPVIK